MAILQALGRSEEKAPSQIDEREPIASPRYLALIEALKYEKIRHSNISEKQRRLRTYAAGTPAGKQEFEQTFRILSEKIAKSASRIKTLQEGADEEAIEFLTD